MRYLTYHEPVRPSYPVCILVSSIRGDEILDAYVTPFGINKDDVLILDLHQDPDKKKTPVKELKQYVEEQLIESLANMQVEYIVCADAEYFKILTKTTKADAQLGYVLDCAYGPWKVIYVPSYKAIFYDPVKIKAKIAQGMEALNQVRNNTYSDPGQGIIQFAEYPTTVTEIYEWMLRLLSMEKDLTCDIECFSLKHHTAGIGTITFCWSQNEGIAFPVDLGPDPEGVRALLKEFFYIFKHKLTFHRITFDVYILIYQLFMKDILDTEGLLEGLDVMLKNWDCSQIITYLATNSCAGNKLGLKDQAQEFAGNYALEEIEDITKIPLPQLLEYNLVDGLCTHYVKNKHHPTMIADNQLDIYNNIFKPAVWDIIQMQLTGLPLNMERVKEVKLILQADEDAAVKQMLASPILQQFLHEENVAWVNRKNAEYKKKRVTLADANVEFNPNSGPQLQRLLYDVLGLPVLAVTKSNQPSTSGDTLKDLRNHTTNQHIIDFLNAAVDYKAVNKILTSFIPAFEGAALGPDGWYYVFGNFNLGGTLSGRLSSSDPNLQNLPATKSRYAKLIKSCFQAPPGWLFAGLDFDSLEDKISGLTTKDPNKLKVYTDGYDGHSLRAYTYFSEQMPDIDPNSVVSINSIEKKYKPLRQESKVPTFALTYQGTYNTLMVKAGFSMEKAKLVEQRYKELYSVSVAWVDAKLEQAAIDGYVTAAFGLRVRTPLLAQVIRGTRRTPYEATAEGRSAGNALGQSWCILNTRAGIEFNAKVRRSIYRLDIRPCAQIHDAQYFLIRDSLPAIAYANEHLPEAVKWQDDPEIYHDEVKLSGEMFICYPDWSNEINLPNGATVKQICETIDKALAE